MKIRRTIGRLLHRWGHSLESHPEVPPLAMRYLLLLQDYTPAQIRETFFHRVLETQVDGVVELYEFMEVMILMEMYRDKTIDEFRQIVQEFGTGVVCDPSDERFGQNTTLTLRPLVESRREEYREAFRFLDRQDKHDGVISEKDLLTAMHRYVWN